MEPTKPRRRWLKFSLGGLLLAITVLCLLLGWQAERVARQRRAVEMVERLGGGVTYDYWGARFDSRVEPQVPNWLHELLGRDWFFTVTSVSLGPSVSRSKVTLPSPMNATDFALLADLPDLERLSLSYTEELTDRELELLSRLTNLEDISLGEVEISDRGLASLAKLKKLRSLHLGNKADQKKLAITDRGLASLRALDQLEELMLGKTSASEVGIARLGSLGEITQFQIELPRGTVVQLDWLEQWPNLHTLILGGVTIEDRGCVALATCPELTGLWLMDCQIPSDGLSALGQGKCGFLGLERTQISADALANLGKLTFLYLNEIELGTEHIESLARLPELFTLDLRHSKLTDEVLRRLPLLAKLTFLYLNHTPISDAGLAGLNQQTDLRYLFLEKTQVTDAGLASLKIPTLVKVDVTGSKVTEAGAEQFRQRTGVEVVTDASLARP